jgi:hypothetical protein
LISGDVRDGAIITVDAKNGDLAVSHVNPSSEAKKGEESAGT